MNMRFTNNQVLAGRLDARDLREIERILAPLRSGAGGRLVLFGSRARADARRASDIDLALTVPRALSPGELAAVREAFEESLIPFRVDLVDYMAVPETLRAAIDREGIAWPM
jgi:predicted nucleotidyltransferase